MPLQVLDDKRVMFELCAPKATQVTVAGDCLREPAALTRGDEGAWSITIGPLAPDIYTYAFDVDGVYTLDPDNTETKPSNERLQNLFTVPGKGIDFAMDQPVPHGEVRIVWYDSPTAGYARRMHVYTPPGYAPATDDPAGDPAADETYPVLYLLHGGGEDDAGWSTIGRAGFILDNLLAAGGARPMIIVMPHGSIDVPGVRMPASGVDWSSEESLARVMPVILKLHEAFIEDLLTTIIPAVESTYRVRTDRESRAMAGLSMGGAHTMRIGPSHLDTFAYMGVFSVGLPSMKADLHERNREFFANPERSNELVKLLWIGAGDDDKLVRDGARRLSQELSRYGIGHEFHETSGGHTWINWRRYIHEFLPRLFVD